MIKRSCWRVIVLILLAVVTIGVGFWYERPFDAVRLVGDGQPFLPTMLLRNAPGGPLLVELADEREERMNGLSRRNGLGSNRGMLFLFEKESIYPFWMKDMRFSIDIIYLHEGVVTQVFPEVSAPNPGQEPKTVEPRSQSDAVLELSAGEAKRRGIAEGTYFQGLPALR